MGKGKGNNRQSSRCLLQKGYTAVVKETHRPSTSSMTCTLARGANCFSLGENRFQVQKLKILRKFLSLILIITSYGCRVCFAIISFHHVFFLKFPPFVRFELHGIKTNENFGNCIEFAALFIHYDFLLYSQEENECKEVGNHLPQPLQTVMFYSRAAPISIQRTITLFVEHVLLLLFYHLVLSL